MFFNVKSNGPEWPKKYMYYLENKVIISCVISKFFIYNKLEMNSKPNKHEERERREMKRIGKRENFEFQYILCN